MKITLEIKKPSTHGELKQTRTKIKSKAGGLGVSAGDLIVCVIHFDLKVWKTQKMRDDVQKYFLHSKPKRKFKQTDLVLEFSYP